MRLFQDRQSDTSQLAGEVWRLFLFLMLLLLIAEGWLILPDKRVAPDKPRRADATPPALGNTATP